MVSGVPRTCGHGHVHLHSKEQRDSFAAESTASGGAVQHMSFHFKDSFVSSAIRFEHVKVDARYHVVEFGSFCNHMP
jgi:hypothetical protein